MKSPSLNSKQKTNMTTAYRGRGKSNSNLWLAYSVKTNRDYIFPSDRQFFHWIYYLEIDPMVASFEIEPSAVMSVDANEARATVLDAKVLYVNGAVEWHEVKSSDSETGPGLSQLQAQAHAARAEGARYRVFSDKDILPYVPICIRWLKALAYASVLRDRSFLPESVALSSSLQKFGSGTVLQLLQDNSEFDRAVMLGLIAEMAIKNHLHLNLETGSYRSSTLWELPNALVTQ